MYITKGNDPRIFKAYLIYIFYDITNPQKNIVLENGANYLKKLLKLFEVLMQSFLVIEWAQLVI